MKRSALVFGFLIGFLIGKRMKKVSKVSSMPEKPVKVKVSKALLGKAIRVGWADGPANSGIIVEIEDGNGLLTGKSLLAQNDTGIRYFDPRNKKLSRIDTAEQIIAISKLKIDGIDVDGMFEP